MPLCIPSKHLLSSCESYPVISFLTEHRRVTRIQFIGTDHPLYQQELDLRTRVLLDPIGIDVAWLEKQWPGLEANLEHYVAVIDHPKGTRVVGCVCLLANQPQPGQGKLMQMVVDPQRQAEGIGRRLVSEIERRAFGDLGLNELLCHAREGSEGFYQRMGWQIRGKPFEEAGIPHFEMVCPNQDST